MLPKGGEVALDGRQTPREAARYRIESMQTTSPAPQPDVAGWTHFARHAEEAGIESVLISFSRYEPDPFVACALGQTVKKTQVHHRVSLGPDAADNFRAADEHRFRAYSRTRRIQYRRRELEEEQRGYGDFLSHDERYERAEEFLAVCNAFWRANGDVNEGKHYRVEQGKLATFSLYRRIRSLRDLCFGSFGTVGSSLLTRRERVGYASPKIRRSSPIVARARARGVGVCLRLCLLCRPTREEAIEVLESLLPEDMKESTTSLKDDSQMYQEGSRPGNDSIG